MRADTWRPSELEEADADPEVRVIIWTGNGRGFCTGDDVKELLGEGAAELSRRIAAGELELPTGPMLRSTTPIIAAVNGEKWSPSWMPSSEYSSGSPAQIPASSRRSGP